MENQTHMKLKMRPKYMDAPISCLEQTTGLFLTLLNSQIFSYQTSTVIFSKWRILSTVIFLSFRTDRSGQTVQTQIRLLLESSLIRVYAVCNSGCIFWVHYSSIKPSCSNFRVITANFLGVRIFRIFTVVYWVCQNEHLSTCIRVQE